MNGQEIIRLTPSSQVNFMIIKMLFETWQLELEKMKSNPFFDYKDFAVNEALREFMNVLSRAIKIEKLHFEPMMRDAVAHSILLAIDPLSFFKEEIEKCNPENPLTHLKESRKYLKWHSTILRLLIDKAGNGVGKEELKYYLISLFEQNRAEVEPFAQLLQPLDHICKLDHDRLFVEEKPEKHHHGNQTTENPEKDIEKSEKQVNSGDGAPELNSNKGSIDPLIAWSKFESEEYEFMKGTIGSLNESIGINQRFMFTRELFDNNSDLLKHALKALDQCDSFGDAIDLLNKKYVEQLNWDIDSDEVDELLQLVFRKFGQKN